MAQTSSVYDNFIIWPFSMTLIINQSEQIKQTEGLLLNEKKKPYVWQSHLTSNCVLDLTQLYKFRFYSVVDA